MKFFKKTYNHFNKFTYLSIPIFFIVFIIAIIFTITMIIPAACSEKKIQGCWYEIKSGKLLIELTDGNSYHALFVGRYNEIIEEEGLYRYSERSKKLSFSPEFVKNKEKSPIYGKDFIITTHSGDSLEVKCLKEKNTIYSFIKDERHIKKGCHCKFCIKNKRR